MPRPPKIIDKFEFFIGIGGMIAVIINSFLFPIDINNLDEAIVNLAVYIFCCFFFAYLVFWNIGAYHYKSREEIKQENNTKGGRNNE